MIFVDTGAWFAISVSDDMNHVAASRWLSLNRQPLITTDYVIDETLTLLRVRGQNRVALTLGQQFFEDGLTDVYRLTDEDISLAWATFQRFTDKQWSFTDCTSKVVMERLGLTHAFAFDEHFRQFGTVTVVP